MPAKVTEAEEISFPFFLLDSTYLQAPVFLDDSTMLVGRGGFILARAR